MEFLVFFVIVWVILICIGMYVAGQKGRSAGEGCLFTLLLGPIGILIVAVLPTIQPPQVVPPPNPTRSKAPTQAEMDEAIRIHLEKQRLRDIAEREAHDERDRIRKEAAMKRRIARRDAYLARGITPGPLAWVESFSLDLMNWYKGLSDLMQMVVWAVCLSIPAATLAVYLFRPR